MINQRLTHFQKFLEIVEKLKNIDLKITEDRKSRIHIFLIIRRRNIETVQIALSDSSLVELPFSCRNFSRDFSLRDYRKIRQKTSVPRCSRNCKMSIYASKNFEKNVKI